MIRYHRMQGHPTLWVPGTDHAGIATQNKVEKDVMENEGKTRHDYGREAFVKKIEAFVAGSQDTIRNQTRRMGASCDWSREYYSLDESLSKTVFATFKKMFEEGLIYRGNRIVNWCTRCYSTISDEEVDYVEKKSKFYYFQYGPFEIGTARPETKYGDHVVVVHPDDERYKKYHGKELQIDWIGDEPITATVLADEASDPEMGSGVMTITPAHSFVDFDLAKKYGFEIVQMIHEEGKMTPANGPFAGMPVEEAREKFVEILDRKGLLNRVDDEYVNKLSVCSRCKTPIQPLVSKQWFIDVNHPVDSWDHDGLQLEKGRAYSLKEVMQHVVRENMIEIIPDRFNKTYFQWIDNLRDWCISRQLWWGHQIPVWYRDEDPDTVKVQEESPGEGWVRDSDTLDTWFSAGLFTFSPLKWIEGHEDFKRFHPTSVLETGYDILFFWVARMILMTTYMTGQVPFEKVYLHGLVRTREGKKMSKSDPSTCIDPLDVIEKYGADALRLSLFVGSSPGNDSRLYDEKIAGYRNFVNKLWNVGRYILMQTEGLGNRGTEELGNWGTEELGSGETDGLTLADKWILSRLESVVQSTTQLLDEYKFSQAAEDLYAFTWNDLADWYVEISKVEKDKDEILMFVLKTLLKLWHPFTPYVTEELWKRVGASEMLMSAPWPETQGYLDEEAERQFEMIRDMVTAVRNLRSRYKIDPAKRVRVSVKTEAVRMVQASAEAFSFLARVEDLQVAAEDPVGNTVASVIEGATVYLHVDGVVDLEEETRKLKAEIAEKEGYLKGLDVKLSNKKFVENAPVEVVDSERKRRLEIEQQLVELKSQLEQ